MKAPLYAAAGVPRLWIIDVNAETVDVYAQPSDGGYVHVRRIGASERLALPVADPALLFLADSFP